MIRKYSLLAEISQYMRGWSSLLFIDKANQVLRFIDYQCIGVAKCVSVRSLWRRVEGRVLARRDKDALFI